MRRVARVRGAVLAVALLVVVGAVTEPSRAQNEDELEQLLAGPPETREGGPTSRTETATPESQGGTSGGAPEREEKPSTLAPAETGPKEAHEPRAHASPPRQRVIEEIVVTAQRREESLKDVPISITALDADFLAEEQITDFGQLATYVGNARFHAESRFGDVRIRGFGSPLQSRSFEQSVGLVVDEIPYTRLDYFQIGFFDLERAEVLRGPQGTLFGKNTTAGLVNVITADPTDELTGLVDLRLGDFDRRGIEAALGGPVVPGVANVRIAGFLDERDGLVENTAAEFFPTASRTMMAFDRKGLRGKVDLPDLLGGRLLASYEHVEAGTEGSGWEVVRVDNPNVAEYDRQYNPNVDLKPGNYVGSIDAREDWTRTLDNFVARFEHEVLGWELDAVGGYSSLDNSLRLDSDASTVPAAWVDPSTDSNPQWTAEVRASSPKGLPGLLGLDRLFGFSLGSSDLLFGVYYQTRDLDALHTLVADAPVLGGLAAVGRTSPPEPPPPAAPPSGQQSTNSTVFFQTTDTYAAFSHLNWSFREPWTLEVGMRLTQEAKDMTVRREYNNDASRIFWTQVGFGPVDEKRDRSALAFTPRVALRWDWSDAMSFFASRTVGFKSGGFNELPSSPQGIDFDDETMESWEIGSKMRLLGGTMTLDTTLFWMEADDLQVLLIISQPPLTLANIAVRNAGAARARGVEVESTWLPTEWLTLRASLGVNDSEFLDFPFGGCGAGQADPDADGLCDQSGRPLARVPMWSGAATGRVRFPLSSIGLTDTIHRLSGIDLTGGLTLHSDSSQFVDDVYAFRQGSFFKLDASAGFGNLGQGWEVFLDGKNLTNKATWLYVHSTVGGGLQAGIPEPRRLLSGGIRWRF